MTWLSKRRKLVGALISGVLLAVCLLTYVFFVNSADKSSDEAVRNTSEIYLREIAEQKQNQIQLNLDNLLRQLAVTAETILPIDISDDAHMRDFLLRMRVVNDFDFFAFADEEGIIHTEEQSFPGISKLSFLGENLTEGRVEFNNTLSEQNLVLVILPLENLTYDGIQLNALMAGIDAATMSERVSLCENDTETISELINSEGGYVIQAPSDHLGTAANFLSAMELHAVYEEGFSHENLEECLEKEKTCFVSYRVDGNKYFTYIVPLETTYGFVMITIPYNIVSGGVDSVRNTIIRNSVIVIIVILAALLGAFSIYYTMRKKQDKIVRAQIIAEENSRAKTDFLSQMSHDIRTPMNAILGFTRFALEETDANVIREIYLPKIHTSSQHLLMLINDVLEMSRIESGKLELDKVPCDLQSLLSEIIPVVSLQAEEKKLTLETQLDITERYVYCDRLRFNQIMTNLLGNAVKFTPEGGVITVCLRQCIPEADGYAAYELTVADTGIGMSEEFVAKVFEPFERERTSTVSGLEGTGLGLSIVKKIVEAMDGSITVTSKKYEGSVFTINLKLRLVETDIAAQMEAERKQQKELSADEMKEYFEGKRILLVEDNEFNRMIAEIVLVNAGFEVEVAADGIYAVEMVKAAPSANYYTAVLMDIQMPIMNGYDAARAIRSIDGDYNKVKIIAVTANAFESDVIEAKQAGMNAHIPKPIDVEELYKVLMKELTK